MVTTKVYDNLNRLTGISSSSSFDYTYNSANQRASVTNADNSRWVYSYDALGQVTSGKKFWSDNTNVAGQAELTADNSASALWFGVTNVAVIPNGSNEDIVASTTGFVFVAQSPELFSHDADGNLTNDGRWSYTWDAENRATSFNRISGAPSESKVKVDCQYDYRWRRTQKIVSTWNGSAYVPQSTNKFVYDGWNLIAILDHQSAILYSFAWSTGLSGTEQGAGGVGGLVAMEVHSGANAGT